MLHVYFYVTMLFNLVQRFIGNLEINFRFNGILMKRTHCQSSEMNLISESTEQLNNFNLCTRVVHLSIRPLHDHSAHKYIDCIYLHNAKLPLMNFGAVVFLNYSYRNEIWNNVIFQKNQPFAWRKWEYNKKRFTRKVWEKKF